MKPRGQVRRRGKDLEEAIFQAVWDELQEVGFARLTVEGVARRAGTSKPVLYRRWPSRAEMIIATMHHFSPRGESFPDRGSLREDAIGALRLLRGRMLEIGRATILGVLQELATNPEPNEPLVRALLDNMRNIMVKAVFTRAYERGELVPAQVTDRLEVLPLDLARMEFLLTGDFPDESIAEIVDMVFLPALEARAAPRDGVAPDGPDLV